MFNRDEECTSKASVNECVEMFRDVVCVPIDRIHVHGPGDDRGQKEAR